MASVRRVNCGIWLKSVASRVVSNFSGGYPPLDNVGPSVPPFPDSTKKSAGFNTRCIVSGDTLLNHFELSEIETVLAHEFGHHVHKDVTMGIIVQSVLTLFGFWLANIVMYWGVAFFGYQGLTGPATLPLLVIALSVPGLVTMPLGNAWSRWQRTAWR